METKTIVVVLQALMEMAELAMREGSTALALELVTYCLGHPSARSDVIQSAEQLRSELVIQLTPGQIEAVQARAQVRTLESLAQEVLEPVVSTKNL